MRKAKRWQADLGRWLQPFLKEYQHKRQAQGAPIYLQGLLSDRRRKSVEPMAARVTPGATQQLHHFVSTSPWSLAPLEAVLAAKDD